MMCTDEEPGVSQPGQLQKDKCWAAPFATIDKSDLLGTARLQGPLACYFLTQPHQYSPQIACLHVCTKLQMERWGPFTEINMCWLCYRYTWETLHMYAKFQDLYQESCESDLCTVIPLFGECIGHSSASVRL
jgi:hypothetical protein